MLAIGRADVSGSWYEAGQCTDCGSQGWRVNLRQKLHRNSNWPVAKRQRSVGQGISSAERDGASEKNHGGGEIIEAAKTL